MACVCHEMVYQFRIGNHAPAVFLFLGMTVVYKTPIDGDTMQFTVTEFQKTKISLDEAVVRKKAMTTI